MKNILLINNTIFYEKDNELYLNKETGLFFLELLKLGKDVSAFQISQLKSDKDSFANFQISNKGITIYEVKRRSNKLLPFIKSFFVIIRAVIKNDFVYIFYPGPICMVIAFICMLLRKPYGIYIRGEQGIYTTLSKLILKKAKVIFTISPKFTQDVLLLNKNVQTIRPMIGMTEDDINLERTIDFKETINLLFVGRIVFDKGIFELLDALKELNNKKYKIHLNLVGSGIELDEFKLRAKNLDLESCISYYGMVSDKNLLIDIYKKSDIFILPTYHEGFPRVLYEAMMMHLPIITTFVGTINFLMKDKINCLKIDPKSTESIIYAVESLINNIELSQTIADNANKTIIEYLSDKIDNHAKQLIRSI